MAVLVADTSALVSLGIVADRDPDPLSLLLTRYDVRVAEEVVAELREIESYDDPHGEAAGSVLSRLDDLDVRSVSFDEEFPLDDGENASVTLSNETRADLFLCDEFNSLGLIHASLVDARLVTTPTLLSAFVRQGHLSTDEAIALLDAISTARSWESNSYVQRVRGLLGTD